MKRFAIGVAQAVLAAALILPTTVRAVATDPGNLGPFSVGSWSYSPATNNATDPLRSDIRSFFNAPDPHVTGLGITMDKVPLSGDVRYPTSGTGPYPIVLVVHGNLANASVQSQQGFTWLLSHLASHGFIAVSVNENFLNGATNGEVDARAFVLLQHLRRWRTFNTTPGHLFYNKVNLNSVGLVGHSRGGEAVTVANSFNKRLHSTTNQTFNFNFGIRALLALAPTDGLVLGNDQPFCPPACDDPTPGYPKAWGPVVVRDAAYMVIQGSRDGDVKTFAGHKTYDRAFPVTETQADFKTLAFVVGANHGYFNNTWGSLCDSGSTALSCPDKKISPIASLSRTTQQAVTKDLATAFFLLRLKGQSDYREVLRGNLTSFYPAGVKVIQQYQHPQRLYVNHFQEDGNVNTASAAGASNTNSGLNTYQQVYLNNNWTHPFGYQDTNALLAGWYANGGKFVMNWVPAPTGYTHLQFRVGLVYDNFMSNWGGAQDFSVVLGQVEGAFNIVDSHSLRVASYRTLPYWDKITDTAFGTDLTKTIMTTVRIPLSHFVNRPDWDWGRLFQIRFQADRTFSGMVVIDDIQYTN
jgi:hypothetical protein